MLLPSADDAESLATLQDRERITIGGIDANRRLLSSPEFHAVATHVILTDGKTPKETVLEVEAAIGNGLKSYPIADAAVPTPDPISH